MGASAVPEFHALQSDRRMVLSYGTLCAEPRSEIARLARFPGADVAPNWLTAAARIPEPRFARWPCLAPDERRVLTAKTEEAREALVALSLP